MCVYHSLVTFAIYLFSAAEDNSFALVAEEIEVVASTLWFSGTSLWTGDGTFWLKDGLSFNLSILVLLAGGTNLNVNNDPNTMCWTTGNLPNTWKIKTIRLLSQWSSYSSFKI